MHLLPFRVDVVPDAGLATAGGHRFTVDELLGQAAVAENNRLVAEPPDMGSCHGDGCW